MSLRTLVGAIENDVLGSRTVVGGLGAVDPIPSAIIGLGVVRDVRGRDHVEVRVRHDAEVAAIQRELQGRYRQPYRVLRVIGAPLAHAQDTLAPGDAVGLAGCACFGTAGGFVRDRFGISSVLSNAHVIADSGHASVGDLIVDGHGSPVAVLSRATRLVQGRPTIVDAAIAELLPGQTYRFGGEVSVAIAKPGTTVTKVGASTASTVGRVVSNDYSVLVTTDLGAIWYRHQLAIEPIVTRRFSTHGDSGSMIHVQGASQIAVGLLCAGDDGFGQTSRTYANHLHHVAQALGLG